MARSRMIKPEFWDDQKLCSISRDARLTFIGLWTNSDDYGVVKGHPAWLKSQIFPYDDIKIQTFQVWLQELEALHVILPFSDNGESFYFIRNFERHQVVNRKSKCRNPQPPCGLIDDSLSTHGALMDQTETETETETELKQKQKPRHCVSTHDEQFDVFWNEYPKKVGKLEAKKAWGKMNGTRPPLNVILSKVQELKRTDQWTKDNGQFIPNPATWLNRGGWDDEVQKERTIEDIIENSKRYAEERGYVFDSTKE